MAIIGYNSVGGSTPNNDNTKTQNLVDTATYTYVAAANQEVDELFFYCGTSGPGDGSGVEVGVYNITSGTASAPLVASGTITGLATSTWGSQTITPVALVEGDTYAVAFRIKSATSLSWRSTYVSSGVSVSTLDGTSALAATWTDNANAGNVPSMYATTVTAAAGPVITDVNTTETVQVGDTPIVTGTSFLATGGTQSWNGVSVGFSSWADTSITSDAITRGDLAYNTNYDWVVTDNLAVASSPLSVQLAIETGFQFVTLSSPIIALVGGVRTSLCYGAVPDCVTGDQLRVPTTTDQGKAIDISAADGTFVITDAGNTEQTFNFEIWDADAATGDKWSASTAVVVNGAIVSAGLVRPMVKDIVRSLIH